MIKEFQVGATGMICIALCSAAHCHHALVETRDLPRPAGAR
jgi:hypothetical protein